jgi:acetyl esterase/lipase
VSTLLRRLYNYRSILVKNPTTIRYGPHRSNVGDLWLPAKGASQVPVVTLIHGGFWRGVYTKRLMNGLAKAVVKKGWAAWNIEYRRVGLLGGSGGWPHTLNDVAAAIDHLAVIDHVDPARVVTCGHSAGGQLALWVAARGRLPAGAPGDDVVVAVRGALSLSGVVDLKEADRLGLGADATARFLGGHWAQQEDRYLCSSPMALLPIEVPQALVHGTNDSVVPPSMSENYQIRATEEGDNARYLPVEGVRHREMIDPDGLGWATGVAELERLIG